MAVSDRDYIPTMADKITPDLNMIGIHGDNDDRHEEYARNLARHDWKLAAYSHFNDDPLIMADNLRIQLKFITNVVRPKVVKQKVYLERYAYFSRKFEKAAAKGKHYIP